MYNKTVIITAANGLHTRPAAQFVKEAKAFSTEETVINGVVQKGQNKDLENREKIKKKQDEILVLEKRRDYYSVLIIDFMIELRLTTSWSNLKVKDMITVTIQHADARKNLLSVFPG